MNKSFKIYYNFFFWFIMSMFFVMFFSSLFLFNFCKSYFIDWELITLMSLKVNFPIYLDFFSVMFLSLVFLISSSIMIYSKSYMDHDYYKIRFILILNLFILSMVLFIISPNLISMLLGWDGLGLVSYCLVIHYQNPKSNTSGMLTALSNRVGDCFLILSICMFMNFYSWNYMLILGSVDELTVFVVILVAITKSAQIPFSSWLPAAMAAPTPVSALVHSSTLVTAGVFLLIRFQDFLFFHRPCLVFISMLGLVTTLMAGLAANLEMDMKKIVALSTLSQLGLMMSTMYLGMKELVFFHLIMHALFKALMFMCSGNFIHLNSNFQDLRFYGSSFFVSPLGSLMLAISNLSLCGLPFLCGFYSKDLILELIFMNKLSIFMFITFIFGVMLTILYSFRTLNFLMNLKFNYLMKLNCVDNNKLLNLSGSPLFLFSTISGLLFSKLFLSPVNLVILPLKMKLIVINVCFLGVILGVFMKNIYSLVLNKGSQAYSYMEFFSSLFFLTFLSKKSTLNFYFLSSKVMNRSFSNGWIEMIWGSLMTNFYSILSKGNILFMMMKLKSYFFIFFLSNILFLVFSL